MKQPFIYLFTAVILISFLYSCGPDEEELRQQEQEAEQARLDSLERAWEAEMEELRQDSIAQAQQDSIAEAEAAAEAERQEAEQASLITFDNNGAYTVQIRSWRSEVKAEKHLRQWKERGFDHAYVERYGNEDTGDIWFRVRMGNVTTQGMARRLQERLSNEYQTESWISSTDL